MRIGIFTAMSSEAQSFINNGATKIMDGAFAIYNLKIGKHDAVLCCPPTVGEIAAAAGCQLLISKYNVDVILNFGVVGALTNKTSLLTTTYVKSVCHYHMDTSEIDNVPQGRYFCFDDVLVLVDQNILNKALTVKQLPVVTCASADKFVCDPQEKAALNATYGAEICDMESAGVLFTCKFNNIPCLLVKCVSDSLFGGANEYEQNAARAADDFFNYATKLIEVL